MYTTKTKRAITTNSLQSNCSTTSSTSTSTSNVPSLVDPNQSPIWERYEKLEVLGQGGSACCYLSKHFQSGELVAIKVIPKSKLPLDRLCYDKDPLTKAVQVVPMEVYILRRINHEHIIKLLGYEEDEEQYFLILEYFGHSWSSSNKTSDLFECIEKQGALSPEKILKILKQIYDVFEYLKKRNVFHLDWKDENILINEDMNIKLIDFGSALIPASTSPLQHFYGTLEFAAPEILKKKAYLPQYSDLYSIGSILYTLMYATSPHHAGREKRVLFVDQHRQSGNWTVLKKIVKGLMAEKPEEREKPAVVHLLKSISLLL